MFKNPSAASLGILRKRMVQHLARQGIRDSNVLKAMASVPRHFFVQEALQEKAYAALSLPIGHGQTISQPYTVALMSEKLEVRPGMRVLEIGTGSGYQAAVLAAMGALVLSVERRRELYNLASQRLRRLSISGIFLQKGDGTLGMPQAAPFERIIVTAGGPGIPAPLVDQLDVGGILLIPVGNMPQTQRLFRLRKTRARVECEDLGSAVFVDLGGDYGWKERVPRQLAYRGA